MRAISKVVSVPIIGLVKTFSEDSKVYITPLVEDVLALVEAGADIVAVDATQRARTGGLSLEKFYENVRTATSVPLLADIDSFENAIHANDLGFDAIATGHYAEVRKGESGGLELHRSPALAKDQSYVLGVLTAEELERVIFPIGASASKADVRAEAEARGLSVANKPDSYDICFIPEGDTADWLGEKAGIAPGVIVDRSGEVLGEHKGAHTFTVGQRKGLHLGRPAADGKPRYVLEIRPKDNTVVVGPQSALAISELAGVKYSWCGAAPVAPTEFFECEVQVRAHGDAIAAEFKVTDSAMVIRVSEPLLGVAPGQTAVLYLGTRVLGQMTIDQTVSAVPVGAE